MRKVLTLVLIAPALLLAGCSTGLLGGKSGVQQASNVPTGNSLTMPPDLQLRPPGQTTQAYQPNPAPAPQLASTDSDIYGGGAAAPAAPQGDIFAQYGISRTKPDGTPKKDWEMKAELKVAIRKKKQQTNPGYGTVFNVGGLFQDN